nr:histidine phosphatase family protein [Actinomycetales bacterium]
MRLILVRHGQTFSNVNHALDTAEPGAELTELGRSQAAALVDTFGEHEIDRLVTSHLVRTQQTAAPLAQSLGVAPLVDPRIREVVAGDLEMANDFRSITTYITTLAKWMTGELSARMPGAETGHEVLERFDAAVSAVQGELDGGTAMFVSHGAIIRMWSAVRAANAPDGWGVENVLGNTDSVVLTHEQGNWRVETWQGIDMPRHSVVAGVSDRDGRL